jgi:hypothetical protein
MSPAYRAIGGGNAAAECLERCVMAAHRSHTRSPARAGSSSIRGPRRRRMHARRHTRDPASAKVRDTAWLAIIDAD